VRLIIDGNNTAYRSNSVMQLTTKTTGENVSAIYGTLAQIKTWVELFKSVTDVVVCWDFGHSQRRLAIYPAYKDKSKMRESQTEEDKQKFQQFIDQMNQLHRFLPNIGVKSVKIEGWEADDLVYGLSSLTTDECILISTDQDYYQLISDRVSVYNPCREKVYAITGVYKSAETEKSGRKMDKSLYFANGDMIVSSFRDDVGYPLMAALSYKILYGDDSDNISGVPDVGEVTAKSLCDMYGSLVGILAARSLIMMSKGGQTWRAKKIFENMHILQRNNLLINLSLVDICTIKDTLMEVFSVPTSVNDKEVKKFFMNKEFVSFMSRYLSWISSFHSLANG